MRCADFSWKGNMLSLSYVPMSTVLSIKEVPERILFEVWHHLFIRGFHVCPSLSFFSSCVPAVSAIITYQYRSEAFVGGVPCRLLVLYMSGSRQASNRGS